MTFVEALQVNLKIKAIFMINKIFLCGLLTVVLSITAGCSSSDKKEKPQTEYYGKSSRSGSLEVPPDLTQTDPDQNISLPSATQNSTGQTSNQQQGGVLSNRRVLVEPSNIKLMRDGDQRWLIVSADPENVWPQLVEYWAKDGIELVINSPESGVIETDWLINYAEFTTSFGKVFRGILNKITASGRRDKYRVSIDFGEQPGTTEIYVAHRGLEEIAIGPSKLQIPDYKWVKRPSDPSLELAIMRQIMVYLGVDEDQADNIAEQNLPDEADKARLLIEGVDEPVLVLDEAFSRAWQRVGLALDRSGYIITGRDRQQGGYLIELANPDLIDKKKPGFFSRLFKGKDQETEEIIYKAQVRLIPQKDEKTVVAIANEEGVHDSSETAISLLRQLFEQLK